MKINVLKNNHRLEQKHRVAGASRLFVWEQLPLHGEIDVFIKIM